MRRYGTRAGMLVTCVAAVGLAGALGGCSATYRNHGYLPDKAAIAEVKIGQDTAETVQDKLGSATTEGMSSKDGTLYYVRQRVKTYVWHAPKTVSREVLAVSFDKNGKVSNIETFGLEKGQVVPLSRSVTAPSTADKTFVRQLLSSLGNFNASEFLGSSE